MPDPPGRIVRGRILFQGQDLLELDAERMRRIRGQKISMIFQEPMTSLNPVFCVGAQISEVLLLHQPSRAGSRAAARELSVELLRMVGISQPERRFSDYPH